MQLPNSKLSDRQAWVCVIDPALALSPYGITLIKQLGKVMEVWIGRELWHILENSALYIQRPELIAPRGLHTASTPQQERKVLEETLCALKAWEKFRLETDLVGLNLFWIGDSRRESFLPKDRDLEILDRWEAIASILDAQPNQVNIKDYILPLAFRDAIALAASLEDAFILTCQLPTDTDKNSAPEICSAFETWSISCENLTSQNAIVAMERDAFRQVLIYTNSAKVVWSGVRLAVLHVLMPVALSSQKLSDQTLSTSFLRFRKPLNTPYLHNNLLTEFRGFWYSI